MKSTILCLVLLITVLGCGNDDSIPAPYIVSIDPPLKEIDTLVLKHPGGSETLANNVVILDRGGGFKPSPSPFPRRLST